MSEADAKSADEWVSLARRLVPRDPDDGTPLHDSIRREASETGGQIVRAGGPSTTKPTKSGKGSYDYARAVEFGTVDMTAQPFFWPAYRTLKKRINARRRRALKKAMEELSRE